MLNKLKPLLFQAALLQSYAGAENMPTFFSLFGGSHYDSVRGITQTQDKGFALTGYTKSYGAGEYDISAIKLNEHGRVLWAKAFGGSADDKGYSIQELSDGGLLLFGDSSDFGAGGSDFLLVKLASDGTLVSSRSLGDTGADFAESMIKTPDGGFLLVGETTGVGYDFLIVKLNSAGETVLSQTVGIGSTSEFGGGAYPTQDGGYLLTGTTSSGAGLYDMFVIKISSDGIPSWAKALGGTGYEYGTSVVEMRDEKAIVIGRGTSFGAGNHDILMAGLTGEGDLLWSYALGGTEYDFVSDMVRGQYDSATFTGSIGSNVVVTNVTSTGELAWIKSLHLSNDNNGGALCLTQDNSVVVGGSTYSLGAGYFNNMVAKLDENAAMPDCNGAELRNLEPTVTDLASLITVTDLIASAGLTVLSVLLSESAASLTTTDISYLYQNGCYADSTTSTTTTGGTTTGEATTSETTLGELMKNESTTSSPITVDVDGIAGATTGGVAFLTGLILLAYFCVKKRLCKCIKEKITEHIGGEHVDIVSAIELGINSAAGRLQRQNEGKSQSELVDVASRLPINMFRVAAVDHEEKDEAKSDGEVQPVWIARLAS